MRIVLVLILTVLTGPAGALSVATYIANEGVLIARDDTRIAFDPLFRNGFDYYHLPSLDVEEALINGRPPFDGIDAIFISHYHGDHFSPADIAKLLRNNSQTRLYAPAQAVDGMEPFLSDDDVALRERIIAIELEYGDPALTIAEGSLLIDAFHIPHSGWPERDPPVQNIAFRVTMDGQTTVLHMGDADPNTLHFERDRSLWDMRETDFAMPPYWFFDSRMGPAIIDELIAPRHAVGVHVPIRFSADDAEMQGRDLFQTPGETRTIED